MKQIVHSVEAEYIYKRHGCFYMRHECIHSLSIMKFRTCFILTVVAVLSGVQADSESRCKRQAGSTCFLMPQATQGPYYWNATYNRPNLTSVTFSMGCLVS